MATLVIGSGAEIALATVIHDHVLYPTQLAQQHDIDGKIAPLERANHSLHHEVGVLTAAEAVFGRHHEPVPRTMQSLIGADRTAIRQNQHQATVLQQERPATPITSDEVFGALLVATFVPAAVYLGLRIRRRMRKTRVREAALNSPDSDA
jgi:hypothetical protein